MHVLLTGASGQIGSRVLVYLLRQGWDITSTDLVPLSPPVLEAVDSLSSSAILDAPFLPLDRSKPAPTPGKLRNHILADLSSIPAVDSLFGAAGQLDGVIHLGAIPTPMAHDHRIVHNNNVCGSWNVLYTAASRGVRRCVQASSVNAMGLSYTPGVHQTFEKLPMDETLPCRPEEAYGLSKQICEMQAVTLARSHGLRTASFRFHLCRPTYALSWPDSRWQDLFCWTAYDSIARACMLALTSEGWDGAEAFNIVGQEMCWEGNADPGVALPLRNHDAAHPDSLGRPADEKQRAEWETQRGRKAGSLEVLKGFWGDRVLRLDQSWWEGRPRRAFWDTTKAEKLLGWEHYEG